MLEWGIGCSSCLDVFIHTHTSVKQRPWLRYTLIEMSCCLTCLLLIMPDFFCCHRCLLFSHPSNPNKLLSTSLCLSTAHCSNHYPTTVRYIFVFLILFSSILRVPNQRHVHVACIRFGAKECSATKARALFIIWTVDGQWTME